MVWLKPPHLAPVTHSNVTLSPSLHPQFLLLALLHIYIYYHYSSCLLHSSWHSIYQIFSTKYSSDLPTHHLIGTLINHSIVACKPWLLATHTYLSCTQITNTCTHKYSYMHTQCWLHKAWRFHILYTKSDSWGNTAITVCCLLYKHFYKRHCPLQE